MDSIRRAVAGRDEFFPLRVIGGTTATALAALSAVSDSVDSTTFILAGIAAVVFTFPWQRLAALKAGPFELSLERAQVKGAIDSVAGAAAKEVMKSGGSHAQAEGVEDVEREKLETLLSQLASEIERAHGGRILWVDDKPARVVAERRLFRALGIETVMVSSCREAGLILMRDNDFDLVITSLEKGAEREAREDIKGEHDFALLFIGWLRGKTSSEIKELMGGAVDIPVKDTAVKNLVVIVYAAYPLSYIRKRIQSLSDLEPAVEGSATPDDLLKRVIRSLADLRSNPIETPPRKMIEAS